MQKLVLTGFIALVDPGTWSQLFLGTMVALFAFVLQVHVKPYRTPSDNIFAFMTSLALLVAFLASLSLLQEDSSEAVGEKPHSTANLILLFAGTLVIFVAAVLFFLAELRQARLLFVIRATGQPPTLRLADGKLWHLCTFPSAQS